MNLFVRALLVVSVASSIGIIASCDDGDNRPPRDCDYVIRRCRTVCDYYFCDSWGCYPSCFNQCWGECHKDPNKTPGIAEPPPSDASASANDASATGAVLCAPCSSNDDCKGGGLCIHRGGADAGDAGAPDAAPTSTGFCGYPCAARNDCPENFTCAEIGTSKQCLPISGKCE